MNLFRNWLLLGYVVAWTLYFVYFWGNSISFDEVGNMSVGNINMWGDWAAHFTFGSSFAYNSLLPDQSPLLFGHSLAYPFVSDWIPGILVHLGLPFFTAFVVPSFLFSVLAILALLWFYKVLSKSWGIAMLASLIFLFNGGTGFTHFITDIQKSPQPLETLLNPPREYTNIEPLFIRWINVIQSMFIPQRAFTVGFPLALLALAILFSWFSSHKSGKLKSLQLIKVALACLLVGAMPILHTHSFMALFVILAFWCLGDIFRHATTKQQLERATKWFAIVSSISCIAIPLIAMFLFGHVGDSFMKWYPGWYSYQNKELDWLTFWFTNWGVVPLLAVVGWVYLIRQTKTQSERLATVSVYLPFFVMFALLNLILFQPFIWDNTKLLVWVSVGFSLLTAQTLAGGWRQAKVVYHKLKHPVLKYLALTVIRFGLVTLAVFTMLTGFIDTYRIIRFPVHTYQMYSREELDIVAWVRETTPRNSVWLTGDQHNHWLYNLTGRQPLLTYRGWLWTHGYDYYQIDADVTAMFANPQRTDLFTQYDVDYVVIGPNEKETWHARTDAFKQTFPVIRETDNYVILQVEK